jgi:hypothetical protein
MRLIKQVKKQVIQFVYIPNDDLCADALTKPLATASFEKHRERILGQQHIGKTRPTAISSTTATLCINESTNASTIKSTIWNNSLFSSLSLSLALFVSHSLHRYLQLETEIGEPYTHAEREVNERMRAIE